MAREDNGDTLERMRVLAREARNRELRVLDLEQQISREKDRIRAILESELVDLMHERGVSSLVLEPEGNHPAYDFELKPYARANIAASWDADRREAAFAALPEGLIKNELSVYFAKGEQPKALKLMKALTDKGHHVTLSTSVHSSTLTAWLKEQLASGGVVPDLDTIGAVVGTKVNIKEHKQ